MGAQKRDLELGQFEPHHFSTLYTHNNQTMQNKINFSNNKESRHRITSRPTQIPEPLLYMVFLPEHMDKQTNEQMWLSMMVLTKLKIFAMF